jgi:hypothetical protein
MKKIALVPSVITLYAKFPYPVIGINREKLVAYYFLLNLTGAWVGQSTF